MHISFLQICKHSYQIQEQEEMSLLKQTGQERQLLNKKHTISAKTSAECVKFCIFEEGSLQRGCNRVSFPRP